MTDRVMKKLMRGIKTAPAPINQNYCAYNDIGAISNNGQTAGNSRVRGRRGGLTPYCKSMSRARWWGFMAS